MKKQKLFAMMTVILAMGLAACGGKTSSKESEKPSSAEPTPSSQVTPSSSSEAPKPSSSSSAPQSSQSTPQPSSSSSAPASSSSQPASSSSEVTPPEPVKAVTVSSVNLVAKESKVYLQLVGTATEYTAAEFKWALALQHAGAAGAGDAATTFVLGTTAEFVDEDYKLPATLNDDGSFLFEYNVSDIAGMEAGLLTIHAGVKGLSENLAVGTVNNGATLKDGTFRFYIRADVNSQNTLAVDELPPVTITEASIVMDDNGKAWAKIGGEADESITQDVLNSFDSFVQFQQVGGSWTNTRRYKAGTYTVTVSHGWGQPTTEEELVVEEDQFYWKKEGTKAYLYADVSFFAANNNYNTHLNARHPTQADLKMETALDEKYTMTNAEGKQLEVNIVAVPGASAQEDFWGNLGFKVTPWVDPTAHVHSFPDDADVEYAATEDYIASRAYNCTGTCGESVLRWNALDYDKTLSKKTTEVKVNGATANNAVKTGDAENDGGTEVKEGNHYVYKVNVSEAVAKAGLAFQIYSRSDDREVFKAQSNDGKNGYYYDEATQTFTKAPARYGVRINGQEVYFDEKLLADEAATPKNSLVWRDFPLNSFALNKGVNTIDVYSMAGYSQAGILQFQLTGLPKVAVSHKHTLGEWQSDENNHWKECSGEGCTLAAGAHIQEAAHEWGDKYDEVAATCEAKGSYKQACKVCGYVRTVETAKADHTWGEAQAAVGDAIPHECSVCHAIGYELALPSPSKLKSDVNFNITGLPAGTYTIQLYACAASTTLTQKYDGRYQFKVGDGEYIGSYDDTATYASYGLGTGEKAENCLWSNPINEIAVGEGAAQFTLHWTNKGYSAFIAAVRLVKIA